MTLDAVQTAFFAIVCCLGMPVTSLTFVCLRTDSGYCLWEVGSRTWWPVTARPVRWVDGIDFCLAYLCVDISRILRSDSEHRTFVCAGIYRVRSYILMIHRDKAGKN